LNNFFRPIIRISAFIRKEIIEVLRQPRLVLSLVLGPFLILLLFGIGFHNEPQPLRTLFVVEPGSALTEPVQEFATTLGPQLLFMGVTGDEREARDRLRRDDVDLVVVAPADAYETIRDSRQAEFILYHNELDPFQQDYIRVFGQVYTDEVNRRVVRRITEMGQAEAESMQEALSSGRQSASAMRQALEQGDNVAARSHQIALARHMDNLAFAVGVTAGVLTGVQETVGGSEQQNPDDLLASLSEVRQAVTGLSDIPADSNNFQAEINQLATIEQQIDSMETQMTEFRQIEAAILVSPFNTQVRNIAPVEIDIADYFAPSVVILLLQHLAVTIAGLSIVRERQLGAVELFRVAPLTPAETLIGKYISYLLFGLVLGLVLILLLVYGLGVPLLGNWLTIAVILIFLLFASLGLGFVISLTALTDSQAVQYAMLVLLTTVFFSGFFLNLQMFIPAVRAVSWLLPATYGIEMLQNVMLRGQPINLLTLAPLAGMGFVLALIAWLLMRRMMANE
jgi:ABC-2 type transport system permease protein